MERDQGGSGHDIKNKYGFGYNGQMDEWVADGMGPLWYGSFH